MGETRHARRQPLCARSHSRACSFKFERRLRDAGLGRAADGTTLYSEFDTWVFVGSNFGLGYEKSLKDTTTLERTRADSRRFHNIYINAEAYAYFLRTREFPEPTILVMEKFAAADREPKGVVTRGMFNGERAELEVAVKNSSRPDGSMKDCSRPDGSTTPWAYYSLTDPADSSKVLASACAHPDPKCESCHRAHASKDNVWVQFYPNLRAAMK